MNGGLTVSGTLLELALMDKELPKATRDRLKTAAAEQQRATRLMRNFLNLAREGGPNKEAGRRARCTRDLRGTGVAGLLADLVATGEPVLAVAAHAPPGRARSGSASAGSRSRPGRRWRTTRGSPARSRTSSRSTRRRTPRCSTSSNVRRPGWTHLAWGEPELDFAVRIHEWDFALREPLTAVYRALRAAGRCAVRPARRCSAGDGPQPRSAALAGRLVRVLAELGLVDLDRDGPALTRGRAPAAHRARALGGLRGLPATARGRTAIPDQPAIRGAQSGLSGADRPDGARRAGPRWPERRRRSRSRRAPPGRPRRSTSDDARRCAIPDDLTTLEHELLGRPVRDRLRARRRGRRADRPRAGRCDAFVFACEHHADQRRQSGEDFITHPVGVAKICAGMRLDTATLCAALLHDTVEDTTASLDEVREQFGEEVAGLVDGVTKLTGITFQSRDEAQAENYRKMMVAMATDIRVILIKLADRLHNMRTLGAMPKQKQIEKAKETLEIYAPLAHRLGIHAIKWELEDLAFATLHPRKYQEIKGLVNQQREERERYVAKAGGYLDQGARGARHPLRDLRPRQALLLDLLEDDPQGPRVQRDLRPHGDARDRRLREGLLRRRRRHPLPVEAAPGPLQGHGGDAEVQHVPGAPHDGDRARGAAAGDPDPHERHARDGRVRRRRALALQGERAARAAWTRPTPSSSG